MPTSKPDPVKALSDFLYDSLNPYLQKLCDEEAVKLVNADEDQPVTLKLSAKCARNDKGRYGILPKASTALSKADSLETKSAVFDPAQMGLTL